MGEVRTQVILENYGDRYSFTKGYIKESEIRRREVDALVDTGSVMLMLPQDLVEILGLVMKRKVVVRYADERKEERPVAGVLSVQIGDREMSTDCIVGPPNSDPLIGQIILEGLDLIPDPMEQKLCVRPESPYLPLLNLK
jgi:predicted aspartyl protease